MLKNDPFVCFLGKNFQVVYLSETKVDIDYKTKNRQFRMQITSYKADVKDLKFWYCQTDIWSGLWPLLALLLFCLVSFS